MGYTKGQKVTLNKAPLYVSSTASKSSGTKTGTFYIWSAATKNGRIRITSVKSYAGKSPASKYVTGWVKTSSIKSSSSSSSGSSSSSSNSSSTSSSGSSGSSSSSSGSSTSSGTQKTTSATSATSTANTTTTTNIVESSNVTPTTTAGGQIGYLGMVLFLVSSSTIQTLNNFKWSMSASYSEHARHLKRPTLEITGVNSDKITFEMELSQYLGVSVMTSFNTLRSYMTSGTAVPLKIGSKTYGNYRWCIESLSFAGGNTDKKGNWTTATVSVSLISVEKKA